ncbi:MULTISPECIES: hypothetical protein [Methanothrix]|jgi:hypothetical protein|uniref:hypothetical protein n=1 Tax=Methanothrix TaxID=2222 RepID=UPI00064F47D0|nr:MULTISPECIES: hypothetical protein [Methanothrix]
MKLKEDEISFLQGYVAQLTQSISRLTLKPSEEEIKKKGWWSSGNERNATTILESKMPVLDFNYKSNNLAHTSPPHIRPSPGSHPPATVAADRKSLGPSHSRPPAPEGRPACMLAPAPARCGHADKLVVDLRPFVIKISRHQIIDI